MVCNQVNGTGIEGAELTNKDIDLCNAIGAVSDPEGHTKHGVDLVVGGHDHVCILPLRLYLQLALPWLYCGL